MIRWSAEADDHAPSLTDRKNAAEETNKLRARQHQPDERYGLHSHTVLDSLLKRHLILQ